MLILTDRALLPDVCRACANFPYALNIQIKKLIINHLNGNLTDVQCGLTGFDPALCCKSQHR
ncbi:hypothetical protein NB724_003038 [Pantoea ananatis]|nr:hypothetical protein [Pantoea ananatis]MCW0336107.1 hypothetical protein [Pantoea ananatis]MCW0384072.1 hypothetical protein [Pantoea ananatis]MCW0408716.1 hypothetical protein [Pantoea ananatis]MCW0428889.1 hypothetical protein [Pantoea ananatis]